MDKYLNELYDAWDNVNEIDFDKLPNQFALKCNHGCSYNIICDDKKKLDVEKTKKKINKWMKQDFGKFNAEPHYNKIHHKIICEEFLGNNIIDYKFYCFNGKVEFMYIASGFGLHEDEKMTFFDKNGNVAPYKRPSYAIKEDAKVPENFEKMKELSEALATEFPFVRVDWFEVNKKIYFSELTFTPSGALLKIEPKEYDKEWGNLLNIK